MYAALWHALPGPIWVRVLLALALAAGALYVLATWGFPWVETVITNQEVTVGNP